MAESSDWYALRGTVRNSASAASMGVLRIVLLFGSAAAALAVILTPIAENQVRDYARQGGLAGIDRMSTGSIGSRGDTYIVRRSVLQSTPGSVCIIHKNGLRSGDC
ncbi:MAG: hypothetical protein R3D65_04595 [Zhengella sp.]|uniref:hypothetical protein n=1 Tax=Zhengella sp. TaxID=2282762 RepID=UPI001D5AD320|nr:hypothetical protein [Notoacmeibacter sp.]MCC0028597.1 hypothetical protein [Brucellaceae bacterium]